MIVAIGGKTQRTTTTPQIKILSQITLEQLPSYEGPTWLDQSLLEKENFGLGDAFCMKFLEAYDFMLRNEFKSQVSSTLIME